jgi:hypothetical protein
VSELWIECKAKRSHPLDVSLRFKVFAMLRAYMDDSGTHEGSHNCVVAGYWGGINEWRRFERSWKAALDREGLREFKANEFWPRLGGRRIGPYRDWTDERHRAFIVELLKIIDRSKIVPFGCGVLGAEWDMQPIAFRELATIADSPAKAKPLLLPFQRNIYRAASYCYPGVTMYFTFDRNQQPNVQSGILRCYSAVKDGATEAGDQLAKHLGSIEFEDSIQAAPLQAADLLAYEMHRYAKQPVRDLEHMREEYRIALWHMKSIEDFWLFDGPRFERFRELFPTRSDDEIESRIDGIQRGAGSDSEG